MTGFILALDQGTTSSRAILFDGQSNIVSIAQKEFTQYFPQAGQVEHDPAEIWSSQATVMAEVILRARINPSRIMGIGITNQRETTILWDRESGLPVCPAIVWQDRRTSSYCDAIRHTHGEWIREKTGLVVDAYFSASKLNWMLDHIEGARKKAEQGRLAFGTVDSWLVWNLTGGEAHITDITNASRTMLFNIHTLEWDTELLELFDIPPSLLPEVKSSSEIYGETTGKVLAAKIPIAGIAGDQHAALFGQMCNRPGMVKNTYGTGCFMLMNTGNRPVRSSNQLVTTIAWKINQEVTYALEGSIFMAGAIVQWLRDELGFFTDAASVEQMAASVPDSHGVVLVPAFAGLGAPHWNQQARGMLVGLTRGVSKHHIARAALECIALQTRDVLKAMEADAGAPITELRVDGGATVNNLLMQLQSDLLQTKVVRPQVTETTALGAAYLAGLATGFWKNTDEINDYWSVDRIFTPSENDVSPIIRNWEKAIRTAIFWAGPDQSTS